MTLDLSGFTIASTDPSAAGTGILINSGLCDLTICNGHIRGGVTNNGGVYTGSGFGSGIFGFPQTLRVSGISVSGCLNNGIYLANGDSTVVESCIVRTVGIFGIVATIIKTSEARDCGGNAITGDQVTDCRGESTSGSGYGLYANNAQNCGGTSNSNHGLSASIAQNCYGFSSSGIGLYALVGNSCGGSSLSITWKYNMP